MACHSETSSIVVASEVVVTGEFANGDHKSFVEQLLYDRHDFVPTVMVSEVEQKPLELQAFNPEQEPFLTKREAVLPEQQLDPLHASLSTMIESAVFM